MRIFGPKLYYVDNETDVPPKNQRGTRRKPYGSMIQLALQLATDSKVRVKIMHLPGKPVVDFTVPGRKAAPSENKK